MKLFCWIFIFEFISFTCGLKYGFVFLPMAFRKEKQSVSAPDLLQALAGGEDIKLNGCTITGVLDVNRLFDGDENFRTESTLIESSEKKKTLTFAQSIVFDKCVFEENVVFAGPWADPESVTVKFKQDVIFNSSVFKGQGRFRNAIFEAAAGFDGCTFEGVVTFKNAVFQQDAKFRTVTCEGYSLFGSAVFESSARFANTHFAKGVNFGQVRFMGSTDFGGVYSSSRAVPVYDSVFFGRQNYGEDESFWRFVKQSAQEAGYYHLAGECFYNERCAGLCQKFRGPDYDNLSPMKKLMRFVIAIRLVPEFILGRMLFGYGERPTRVLIASAMIILLCALIYTPANKLVYRNDMPTDASFFRGLYFSTITFTTLGYGDLYPSSEGFIRVVAMIEAIAGGCLMALFVVCLAKRFSRG
jgi:hypothetical protein